VRHVLNAVTMPTSPKSLGVDKRTITTNDPILISPLRTHLSEVAADCSLLQIIHSDVVFLLEINAATAELSR
jgi:hypothetical protein